MTVFKVLVHDAEKIKSVYVFHGMGKKEAYAINVPVLLSLDDPIFMLKTKILHALFQSNENVCLADMYLFGCIERQCEYEEINQPEQYIKNHLSINAEQTQAIQKHPLTENSPWFSKRYQKIPIGLRLQARDPCFPGNPFDMLPATPNRETRGVEEEFLFRYGTEFLNNELHLCLASDVHDFFQTQNKPFRMLETYFPHLVNMSSHNKTLLHMYEMSLVAERKKLYSEILPKKTREISDLLPGWQAMDFLYHTAELKSVRYESEGVESFQITLIGSTEQIRLPINAIFKSIHATKEIPYIQYCPGKAMDNMLRLYFEETAINGNRIPFLPEEQIMKWNLDIPDTERNAEYLSFFVVENMNTFQITFESKGYVKIRGHLATKVPLVELDPMVVSLYKRVTAEIGDFLAQSDYSLPPFDSLWNARQVETDFYNYSCAIKSTTEYNFSALETCWNVLFARDLQKRKDAEPDVKLLKYVRVENYKQMDALNETIAALSETHKSQDLILAALQTFYDKPLAELKQDLKNYNELYKTVRYRKNIRQTLAHSGFPVKFLIPTLSRSFCEMRILNIKHIEYFKVLPTFIQSLFLIYTNQVEGKSVCTKKREIQEVPLEMKDTRDAVSLFDSDSDYESDTDPLFDFTELKPESESEVKPESKSESESKPESKPESESESNSEFDPLLDDFIGGAYKKKDIPNARKIFSGKLAGFNKPLLDHLNTGDTSFYSKCINGLPIPLRKDENDALQKKEKQHVLEYQLENTEKVFYACPTYWCTKPGGERALTKEEAESKVCGDIIQDPKAIKPGEYVLVTTKNNTNEPEKQLPGFVNNKINDKCYPCCYPAKKWDNEIYQKLRNKCNPSEYPANNPPREKELADNLKIGHVLQYNDKILNTALDHGRRGELPGLVAEFMKIEQTDWEWFRYGVEKTTNQSFLACLADLYSWKFKRMEQVLLKDFRKILVDAFSLDIFLSLHNGALVNVFDNKDNKERSTKKYETSRFYTNVESFGWNSDNKKQFVQYTIRSYEHFLEYLLDEKVLIDHTYLWEFLSKSLFGINLVIFDLITKSENLHILRPAYPFGQVLDASKETLFLCKQNNNYELIIRYKKKDTIVQMTKLFPHSFEPLKQVFAKLTKLNDSFSVPAKNVLPEKMYSLLKKWTVEKQIKNYHQKVCGFVVSGFFVPCFPAMATIDLPTELEASLIGTDYFETIDFLTKVHEEFQIPCQAAYRVVEHEKIIGILTKTHQFVRTKEIPNMYDNLPAKKSTDFIKLDTMFAQNVQVPKSQVVHEEAKSLFLENQFYQMFRTIVRLEMKKHKVDDMQDILKTDWTNAKKRASLEARLRTITKRKVAFVEYEEAILATFLSAPTCSKKKCPFLYSEHGVFLIPKTNLATHHANDKLYYGRLADEMVRNRQVQPFMFYPDQYLNLNQTEYLIHADEFLIPKSFLTKSYFEKLVKYPFDEYAKETTYDTWNP